VRWHLPRFRREGAARAAGGETPFGRVHLLKPQTYMNRSGAALSGLRATEPGQVITDLLVLVDDFAIPTGTFRLRPGGSAGGHNGLKSVEAALGTQAYPRLRIGVGPAPEGTSHRDYVLEPMETEERRAVEELLPLMCEAVECWMAEGIDKAMARFNRKAKPAEDDPEPS